VILVLGEFSAEALRSRRHADGDGLPRSLTLAILYYLAERDSRRPAWSYPAHLRREDPEPVGDGPIELEVSLDDAAWKAFGEEAERQGVSVERLAEHAALYLAADMDSGRLSRRILDELAGEEA
jgi:hypothetical protein